MAQKTLIIRESQWLHAGKTGHNPGNKYHGGMLLDPKEGRMCCLGIASKACGVSDNSLKYQGLPDALGKKNRELVRKNYPWMFDFDFTSREAEGLVAINDDKKLTLRSRRCAIKAIFKKHGVHVVFKP